MGKISDALNKAINRDATEALDTKEGTHDTAEVDYGQFKSDLSQPKVSVASNELMAKKIKPERKSQSPVNRNDAAASDGAYMQQDMPKYVTGNINPKLISYSTPKSFEAEQFRIVRTNVLFPKNEKPAKSIIIASMAPAEGKSFVAANLAISIAQNIDKHVLLVDCDMRNPNVHKLFGYGQVPGLSDHLLNDQPLPTLLLKTFSPRLTILPGGTPPANPSELLSSNRMEYLLREVKYRYEDRFIIIDTPPILLAAETRALAELVDGCLLVVRFGKSNKAHVKEIIDKIGKEKFLGIIGNWAEPLSSEYYYGKEKFRGYSYYGNK